jgi:hypothetical protein
MMIIVRRCWPSGNSASSNNDRGDHAKDAADCAMSHLSTSPMRALVPGGMLLIDTTVSMNRLLFASLVLVDSSDYQGSA